MSQSEIRRAHKLQEGDWLKSATNGKRFAHKLQQFEGDGSKSATMRGRLVHKPERDRALVGAIFSIPEHCFVAKQLNKTLFCRDTLKYGTCCRKLLKYAQRAEKHG